MFKKLIHFLVRLIITVFILAVILGVPSAWMIRRSYHDPEVHYFYTELTRTKEQPMEPEAETAEAGETKAEASEAGEQEVEAAEAGKPAADDANAAGSQSLRFVVLSDLYGYVFEGGNGIIADLTASTFPDAILIGGNLISGDAEDITQTTDLLRRLSQIAPVYYAYGDEELRYARRHSAGSEDPASAQADPLREALKKAGATVIHDAYKDVKIYGIDVRIGTVHSKAYELTNISGDVKRKTEKTWELLSAFQDTDSLKIMISDKTENFVLGDACESWDIDLIISGSDLGGLVVLPYYGGVFSKAQGYFPAYVHGMYEKGNADLLITSGLSAPRGPVPRFNNPPEIAVLDIEGLSRSAK